MIGNLSFLYLAAMAFGSVNAADHGAQQTILGLPANNPVKQPWIWPLPQKWERGNSTLKLANNLHFNYHGHSDILHSAVKRYENLIYLKDDYPMIPYNWSTTDEHVRSSLSSINIDIQDSSDELNVDTDESYTLTIPVSGQATIKAPTVYGALHAIETFSQIVQWSSDKKAHLIPNAPWSITDYPKYKHRGLLFDTARHYYTPKDIYKVIDTMSWNKMNVLHWHFIDSTSFPYVSKAYPQLAEKGAYSPAHTYDDKTIKAIVQYAKERGVRVMPEVEAPGHSTAWAYGIPEIGTCTDIVPYTGFTVQPPSGQLNIASNKTKEVVNTIVDELSELFPDSWFHASGDEVVMDCWSNDTEIAAYLKQHNLTTLELFEQFVNGMQDHIRTHNKTVMVWQEMILEYNFTLPKDTVVQVWVGSSGVKATTEKGYRTIVSSSDYWYLDVGYGKPRSNPYPDVPGAGYNHWNRVYSYDMRANLTSDEAELLLGGECTMWGELADHTNFEGKIWPRASAVAERLWSGYETPSGENITSADAILRLLPWRDTMLLRGTMASPLNQGFCTRNPLDCFQPPETS
ncbi:Glucosamine-6-phosphate isomerase (Glucosamine-6-phosphate deaminase) (GNPDA) (GlcN6P deaminase) [Umbelopsis sp. WA50703]